MKYLIFICTFIAFQNSVFCQQKIINPFTPKHKLIKYSKVFLIPPKGFHSSPNLMGLVHSSSGANMIVLQFNKSFNSIHQYYTNTYFQKKENDNIHRKYDTINNLSACWIDMERTDYDKQYLKCILLIGNQKEYVWIEAICPKEEFELMAQMKQSMQSIYFDVENKFAINAEAEVIE
jgi:hypothetical protein